MDIYFYLEIVAVLFALAYLFLLIAQRIECWIFGIFGSLLSIFLFIHSKLYSEAILYSYYVFMGVYGYYIWSQKEHADALPSLQVNKANTFLHVVYVLLCVFLALILASLFDSYTDAELPYFDAFTTVFSFLATFLEARKVLSAWLYWIVINGSTIFLYSNKGLDVYAGLSLFYFIMSFVGYSKWKKSMKIQ